MQKLSVVAVPGPLPWASGGGKAVASQVKVSSSPGPIPGHRAAGRSPGLDLV